MPKTEVWVAFGEWQVPGPHGNCGPGGQVGGGGPVSPTRQHPFSTRRAPPASRPGGLHAAPS